MLTCACRQELAFKASDIPVLVRGMTELLERSLSPAVMIETRFPLGLHWVTADPDPSGHCPGHPPPPIPSRLSVAACAAISIPYKRAAFSPKILRLISKVRSTWYSCFKSSGNSYAINFSINHLGDQIA